MSNENTADSFRRWGYLQASLDPLQRLRPAPHAELDEMQGAETERWRAIYCGSIGAQFMHMPEPERRRFIAERLEAEPPPLDRRRILQRLAEAEIYEGFLHARYVGTKRYSLEGAAALVTAIDETLEAGAERGAEFALIGMSHRGRLPVMARVIHVPPSLIFAGFDDLDPRSALGGGDVKYHLGATGEYRTTGGKTIAMHLVSNPSHLEAVDPVLMLALLLAVLTTVFNLQEQTLTVVPKIIMAFALAFVLTPWMLRQIVDFTVLLLRDTLGTIQG